MPPPSTQGSVRPGGRKGRGMRGRGAPAGSALEPVAARQGRATVHTLRGDFVDEAGQNLARDGHIDLLAGVFTAGHRRHLLDHVELTLQRCSDGVDLALHAPGAAQAQAGIGPEVLQQARHMRVPHKTRRGAQAGDVVDLAATQRAVDEDV